MNHSPLVFGAFAGILALIPATANAELIDRGDGLIYDSAQNLTWTQDANINGKMSWEVAMRWADNLEYQGFDDWRLPKTTQFDDPTCLEDLRSDTVYFNATIIYERHIYCLGGEMEQLTAEADPYNNPLFYNVSDSRYWTGVPYRDGVDPCVARGDCPNGNVGLRTGFYWQWSVKGHHKTTLRGGNPRYAWAVRDGDVFASDSPATLSADLNNLHIPSLYYELVNRTDNIWADFSYDSVGPEGESLWSLTGFNYNTPALSGSMTGRVSTELTINIPEVIYEDTSYWATFEYYGQKEDGSYIWELTAYGENS